MGTAEGSPDPHCDEDNNVYKYMDLNYIFNEVMDMMIDKLDLNYIGETVDNTSLQKKGHGLGFK